MLVFTTPCFSEISGVLQPPGRLHLRQLEMFVCQPASKLSTWWLIKNWLVYNLYISFSCNLMNTCIQLQQLCNYSLQCIYIYIFNCNNIYISNYANAYVTYMLYMCIYIYTLKMIC